MDHQSEQSKLKLTTSTDLLLYKYKTCPIDYLYNLPWPVGPSNPTWIKLLPRTLFKYNIAVTSWYLFRPGNIFVNRSEKCLCCITSQSHITICKCLMYSMVTDSIVLLWKPNICPLINFNHRLIIKNTSLGPTRITPNIRSLNIKPSTYSYKKGE